ncbi:calcium-binding protein [Sphingomonas sp. URHD0057]|uniref:calcium-binding protein n=1 Tax=Sphingomonas sp. URHD0057 TaxID=1380389 RepID=UPI00049067F2|nr:M10 family metallopeptidase C-terminal domain-containing protein [Sphingomonas sp. URHD0057]
MPRIPTGQINLLATYTFIPPADPPDPPEQDYYTTEDGLYTIWGVGLITYGAPTQAQKDWIADPSHYSNLSTFPTDYVTFGGFPIATPATIPLWEHVTRVNDQVLLTEQGVSGADSWSLGGLSGGTETFFWSDALVTNGTNSGETLNGTGVAETLNGLGGDDTLNGGGGSDALHGGAGNDVLNGGDGIDRLWGDDGNDILNPGSDAAFIYIEGGVNRAGVYSVDGGSGFDTLVLDYSAATKSQSISGAQTLASPQVVNVEALNITGSQFSDFLTGSANADQLFGGAGFDYLSGGGGNDTLDAGAPGASSVTTIGEGGHSNDDAVSLDHLFSAGSDLPSVNIHIDSVETNVSELWGARPKAGGFYSFTVGEAGDQAFIDFTVDNELSDVAEFHIKDANGVEVAWDGDPAHAIVFPHAGTYYLEVVIFQDFNPWAKAHIDVTLSLEGADVLSHNVLEGGTGDDTYIVYAGTDQVIEKLGEGTDLVRSSFSYTLGDNVENLTLTGAAAINGTGNGLANVITGNSAANTLIGGGGGDTLIGGGGGDMLTGGVGADRFTLTNISDSAPLTPDRITDFAGKKDGDKIDLSAIDADATAAGDQAFKLVNKFSGQAGQLTTSWDKATDTTSISLDVDGDRTADMVIQLSGHVSLTGGDFIF